MTKKYILDLTIQAIQNSTRTLKILFCLKEKKVDELTKQVIRFKRIQEIVLSAQTNLHNSIKNKSKHLKRKFIKKILTPYLIPNRL